jgi:hypothetical protein
MASSTPQLTTLPHGDPTDLSVALQREGNRQLGAVVPAHTAPRLGLRLRPLLLAVGDERAGAAAHTASLGDALERISGQAMGRSTAAADRLQDTVGRVALGGNHAKVLGKISEVLARPPLAGSVDHLSILTQPPDIIQDSNAGTAALMAPYVRGRPGCCQGHSCGHHQP